MSDKDQDKPPAEEPGNELETAEEADRRMVGDPDDIPHFVGSQTGSDEAPSDRPRFTGTPVAGPWGFWRRQMRRGKGRNDR